MTQTNHNNQRVALITGASRGLGATLARFLAAQGYILILTARGADTLEKTAASLRREFGANITTIAGDIAEENHRRALADAARAAGGLDLLVNNASDLGKTPLPGLVNYPLDALLDLFLVNVVAQVGLVQATLPYLKTRRGLVVNLSSDAAVGGYPGWGGYGATKAALDLAARTLANELRDDSVGVVSVDPGDMRTVMQQQAFAGEDISDRPLPEVTLPFWGWLLGQDPMAVSGRRFQAQAETWTVPDEA